MEDFLTQDEVDRLRKQCHQIVEDMDPKEHKPTVFSTVNRVHNVLIYMAAMFQSRPILGQDSDIVSCPIDKTYWT